MALALMFLKTNSTSAANGLLTPDTLYQSEAIRPDFLLLRVRNIICCMITLNHHYTGARSQFNNVGFCKTYF